ncbi:uncharacterized protein LOC107464666 isoform X4 [Arachis duranensis]|nr:uncharacterized protein LOC107464666 isoform X4 [Arachis duranensis]XP_052110439.1 uncharacterized protein LOC107464666 isoform X4 [Arachis duranensis]XP_052110440.1 uncharacterized protein LOC107464666 isoform X4 [Arachis duranensis]XP_052110441.1 uncharacterized protein LOC107464666 isoform X4 [Arachis duranensis]
MVRRKVVATDECTGTSSEAFRTSTHFQKHDLYTWVVEEVKNTPSTITRERLDELKGSGVIFTFDDVVKMAGGTEAITAMRRRLGTNTIPTNTEGMDMIYSSATHSNLSPPEPQKSALNIEILYSHPPSSSLVRKKQKSKGKRLMKSTTTQGEDLRSYGCVLKKDFRYCDFVDSFLLIEATKSKSVEMPVEDTLPRIQKMLLGSVAFVRDVEKEIPSFRSKIASKEKELQTSATQIQILNTTLASLQEDNRKLQESIKYLREDKKTSASQVKDLMIKVVEIEKNNSTLAKTAENAE